MNLKVASINDLNNVKKMFQNIIEHMNSQGIDIWDDIYPCEFFEDDIRHKRLYVLEHNQQIIAAFALNSYHDGAKEVLWSDDNVKAIYIEKLGVSIDYLRQGIGIKILDEAISLARQMKMEYLRLFVVESNLPAIALYKKAGFNQVKGIYSEHIDDGYVLNEYGYEKKV